MKQINLIIACLFSLILFSCENKHDPQREDILIDIIGEWQIYQDDTLEGTIMFDEYESFMMESNKGMLFGNYTMLPNKSNVLSFYYIETEDGEEYQTDGFVELYPETPDIFTVENLPYYEGIKLKLVRQ